MISVENFSLNYFLESLRCSYSKILRLKSSDYFISKSVSSLLLNLKLSCSYEMYDKREFATRSWPSIFSMILSFSWISLSFSEIFISNFVIFYFKILADSTNSLFSLYLFLTSLYEVSTFLIISNFETSSYLIRLVSSSTSALWVFLIL